MSRPYFTAVLALFLVLAAFPGIAAATDTTIFLAHLNGALNDAGGSSPLEASGVSFEGGLRGQGLYVPPGARLRYPSAGNIRSGSGTLELWIKSRWAGDDGANNRCVLTWGGGGGMLFFRDGGDYWRIIANRFGVAQGGEQGAGTRLTADWQPGQWRHAAFTWTASSLRLYLDGELRASAPVTAALPAVAARWFWLGSAGDEGMAADAVLDEVRICSTACNAEAVRQDALAGLSGLAFSSLSLSEDVGAASLLVGESWQVPGGLVAQTAAGPVRLGRTMVTWGSEDQSVAVVTSAGQVRAVGRGTATITAHAGGRSCSLTVQVEGTNLPPVREPLAPFLRSPAAGCLWRVPVLVISYLPTRDGLHLDSTRTGWGGPGSEPTLGTVRRQIVKLTAGTKFALEQGSRYRAYSNPAAAPSLGYRIVDMITVFEPLPPYPLSMEEWRQPDYRAILNRFDIQRYLREYGVKEVWINGYHYGGIAPVESNMASPTTGDISNSARLDDLPVLNRTYVVYNTNYTRGLDCAVENHMHQIESQLIYQDWKQNGSLHLWDEEFVGFANGQRVLGRCGWSHMPPNTAADYDWANETIVESDIEDWRPGGGRTRPTNCRTWLEKVYAWPLGSGDLASEGPYWFIYWMQSHPGRGNVVPYQGGRMTNWWRYVGDWDGANADGFGLYKPAARVEVPLAATMLAATAAPAPHGGVQITICLTAAATVRARIRNLSGRELASLSPRRLAQGTSLLTWNGRSASGTRSPGGVYLIELVADAADGGSDHRVLTVRR